ncbi:hypothetical protein ENTCAN_06086, partial [Enterobacter cancerogenus ATCC 35316]
RRRAINTIIIVALATAKRQKIDTGAATGPCCRKMAIQVVPQMITTSPYSSAFIVPLLRHGEKESVARSSRAGFQRFAQDLQILALFYPPGSGKWLQHFLD